MGKSYVFIFKILILLVVVVFVMGASSVLAIKNLPGIANGVYSEKISLAGMDEKTAQKTLNDFFTGKTSGNIIDFHYDNKIQKMKKKDIDLDCDSKDTVIQAKKIGASGNFIKDSFEELVCSYYGKSIPLKIKYNKKKLNNIIENLAKKLEQKPVNAYCYLDKGQIKIMAGKDGREVDKNQLLGISQKALSDLQYPTQINIPLKITKPAIGEEQLQNIDTLLASYTSYFNARAANRSRNIAVAARNLSGTLVKPGEVFSFNDTVGPRLLAAGYKEAPVIINGKLVPGIGGGVCQVSSTLYNAILLSGLTPVSRTAHYFPVGYMPRALDATVAYGIIDFKFKNNLTKPIYVYAQVDGSAVTVKIFGSKQDKSKFDIALQGIVNRDGSASAYRLFKNNGRVIKREFLHTDVVN